MKYLNVITGSLKNKPFFAKQISGKDEIGRIIELISSLSGIKSIVEIGSFNGRGSSKQIVNGVKKRKRKDGIEIVGIEAQEKLYKLARKNLPTYFKLLHGRISEIEKLDHLDINNNEEKWHNLEREIHENSIELNLEQLPELIDLLILDGGEFSTYNDFILLHPRVTNFLVLDDIHTLKCRRLLNSQILEENYTLVYFSHERNGIALFIKKKNRKILDS